MWNLSTEDTKYCPAIQGDVFIDFDDPEHADVRFFCANLYALELELCKPLPVPMDAPIYDEDIPF